MRKSLVLLFSFSILLLVLLPNGMAFDTNEADVVIVNAKDWRDAYSGMLYGKENGKTTYVLTSENQALQIAKSINNAENKVVVFESEDPRVSNLFEKTLDTKGIDIKNIKDGSIAKHIRENEDFSKLVVVDDLYASNSVAVASYVMFTNSWVVFINDENVDEIQSYISKNNFEEVMFYGKLAKKISEDYSGDKFVINTGNRFTNNIEIIKQFLKIKESNKIILADGMILEEGFFNLETPTLILGANSVPSDVQKFIGESDFDVAEAIGSGTVGLASKLKKDIKQNYDKEMVFVAKIAQTSRNPSAINELVALDYFQLPVPLFSLKIEQIRYNKVSGMMEVLFFNDGEENVYYIPTLTLSIDGDVNTFNYKEEYLFLGKNEKETLLFSIDLNDNSNIEGSIVALYGDSPEIYEYSSNLDFDEISFITIQDNSAIEVKSLIYSIADEAFLIEILNTGKVTAHVNPGIYDVNVKDELVSFRSKQYVNIATGETAKIPIYGFMSDLDLANNDEVSYDVKYGQRKNVLIKSSKGKIKLTVSQLSLLAIMIIAGFIFICILAVIMRKKKYVCVNCGGVHKTRMKPKVCVCGSKYFRK